MLKTTQQNNTQEHTKSKAKVSEFHIHTIHMYVCLYIGAYVCI